MRFEGKGPSGTKLAAFFNRCLTSPLSNHIHGSRGIDVYNNGERGVTVATHAPIEQVFKLTDHKKYGTPPGSGDPITGVVVNADHTDESTTEHDIYFTYAPDFYGEGEFVRCQQMMGQWEAVSPGTTFARATLAADAAVGDTKTCSLEANIGDTTDIDVYFELFSQTVSPEPLVYATWCPQTGTWYSTGKKCP